MHLPRDSLYLSPGEGRGGGELEDFELRITWFSREGGEDQLL